MATCEDCRKEIDDGYRFCTAVCAFRGDIRFRAMLNQIERVE